MLRRNGIAADATRRSRGIAACLLLVVGLFFGPAPARAADLIVFAAASLKNALDDAVQSYARQGGEAVKVSYAASSALAKQIENGAPADIFISADVAWMVAFSLLLTVMLLTGLQWLSVVSPAVVVTP